jgi:uncharacterized SAM-dependent methyltransferase
MVASKLILDEMIKKGHSRKGTTRVWNVANTRLWYLTPELIQGYLNLEKYDYYKQNILQPEISLLKKNAKKIIKSIRSKSFNLIDIGCSDGSRAEILIKSAPKDVNIRYCAVGASPILMKRAADRIRNLKLRRVKEVKEYSTDILEADVLIPELRNGEYQKNVCLFLGSALSHFEINHFLFKLSKGMIPDEILIIGNGIRKGKNLANLYIYKDPIVDKWFVHIMKEIGFLDNEVEWDVRFENKRLEGFYKIKKDRDLKYKDKYLSFKNGDEILVGFQYKYFARELEKFCGMYFREVELDKDKNGEFALVNCVK